MQNSVLNAALAAAAILVLASATLSTAEADGTRRFTGARAVAATTQPKDCTRLNARIGYYANPWCNAAEQRAWDLWDARRQAVVARK